MKKILQKTISALLIFLFLLTAQKSMSQGEDYLFNDSHYHLTNYIQEGPSIEEHLKLMGDKVGRVAIFGIPLQQQWSFMNSGDDAPKYYLDTDAPLYYYSFTDAYIAMQYLSLTDDEKKRFDPMITGFNPADMYAADHIKRVLKTFPGVFTGIGEFTIHKEFVSSKVAGEVASLLNPALDTILRVAGEIGLVVILHNDIDKPFPKSYTQNYVDQLTQVFRDNSNTNIIWAHVGLGRVVRPVSDQIEIVKTMIEDPTLGHVYFDISWDQTAKYIVDDEESIRAVSELFNSNPDRFLFGTDEVAMTEQSKYMNVYEMYEPLWKALTPETKQKITKGNYERLFDEARLKVRAWEQVNVK